MNIVQITPGAGGMYCGNCFRDNALVAALRRKGHTTLMVPLYLPMTLDEPDQSAGTPVFFGGISVYLEQKSALFRKAPGWLHRWLRSPRMLKWAAGRAASTRAEDVGDLSVSMLRGENGHQARELDELVAWLRTQPAPDIVCLSNAMLAGLARRIRNELGARVVCTFQGEDTYMDSLSPPFRQQAWDALSERAQDVDLFIAPSRYFGDLMGRRLGLSSDRVRVIYNGINLDGYAPAAAPPASPVIGFFARMSPQKGLDVLVEAFILLKQRSRVPGLRLRVGGGCGSADEPFVARLRQRLQDNGILADVEFFPNVDRETKLGFLRNLTVFSTPSLYGEAFGMYVIEALASGVPVVQPRHAAFPETVDTTGGGLLCDPGSPAALADALESLLLDPARARELGQRGRAAVLSRFTIDHLADETLKAFAELLAAKARPALNPAVAGAAR